MLLFWHPVMRPLLSSPREAPILLLLSRIIGVVSPSAPGLWQSKAAAAKMKVLFVLHGAALCTRPQTQRQHLSQQAACGRSSQGRPSGHNSTESDTDPWSQTHWEMGEVEMKGLLLRRERSSDGYYTLQNGEIGLTGILSIRAGRLIKFRFWFWRQTITKLI